MTRSGDATPAGRFEFATATRIIFGDGTSTELPALAAAWGQRALLVTGANAARHAPLIDALQRAFQSVAQFAVKGEPTVACVEAGAQLARAEQCEVVIALGGGSVIDGGKAIAALAVNPGPALDYLEVVGRGLPLQQPSLPLIAVPTTAGTGAEVTRNAVLAVDDARVKVSLRSVHLLPRLALVDPVLTHDLPPAQTAASGLDALTQLIEPFLSSRANPLTDALCRDGIARAARALPVAMREPHNAAARSDVALAALYSGLALANAGLGAVHGLAAPIGGRFPAPHGAVCAALLPHVLQANLRALRTRAPQHPALARCEEVAGLLTGSPGAPREEGIAWCAQLAQEFEIPRLSAYGMVAADLADIAQKAAAASSMKANPLPLTADELVSILEAAL